MLQKLADLVEKIEENPVWLLLGGILTVITASALILLIILVRALVCL